MTYYHNLLKCMDFVGTNKVQTIQQITEKTPKLKRESLVLHLTLHRSTYKYMYVV